MLESLLRYAVVEKPDETVERLFEIVGAVEVMAVANLRDAPVEALDHAVDLRLFGPGEPVLDA